MGFCRGWLLDELNKEESGKLQEALKLMAKMLILTDVAIRSSRESLRMRKGAAAASSSTSQETAIEIEDVFAAEFSDRGERFLYITFDATEKVYNTNPETDDAHNNIIHLSFEEILQFLDDHPVKTISFGDLPEEFCMWDSSPAGQRYIKNNHCSYDILITACLTILYHYLPNKLHLKSDYDSAQDYYPGVQLASLLLNEIFKNPCDPNGEINFALPYPIISVNPSHVDLGSFVARLITFARGMTLDLADFGCFSDHEKINALECTESFPIQYTICGPVEFARNVAKKLKELQLISWELRFTPSPNSFLDQSLHALVQLPQSIADLLKTFSIVPIRRIVLTEPGSLAYRFVRLTNNCVDWLIENGFLSRKDLHFVECTQFDDAWITQHRQFLQSVKEILQSCLSAFREKTPDGSSPDSCNIFVSQLLTGKIESFHYGLQDLYLYSIGDADSPFDKPDEFYRGWMTGLIASSADQHRVNLKSFGTEILVVEPQKPDDPQYNIGIIIVFKHTANAEKLYDLAAKGLQQAKESDCTAYLESHAVKNITAVSIVFFDRKVVYVAEWLKRAPQPESTSLITCRGGSDSPLSSRKRSPPEKLEELEEEEKKEKDSPISKRV